MAPIPSSVEDLKAQLEVWKETLTEEKNRPYVVGGAVAAVAAAGLVYYLRSTSGKPASDQPASEAGTPSKSKKKKSGKSQEKRSDEEQGEAQTDADAQTFLDKESVRSLFGADATSDVATPPPEAATPGDSTPSRAPYDVSKLSAEVGSTPFPARPNAQLFHVDSGL
jgi:hypothetical protein